MLFTVCSRTSAVKRAFVAKHVGVRIDLRHVRVFEVPSFDLALVAGIIL